jgi:hypothetical protein
MIEEWPVSEPDEIEREVIRVISAIPKDPKHWADSRSGLARLTGRLSSNDTELKEENIKENWTKEIVRQLVELGSRLKFRVDDSHNVTRWNENWMYDVIWRKMDSDDGWTRTYSLPLVLECTWYTSRDDGYPDMRALDRMLLARADHRVMVCQSAHSGRQIFERVASTVELCGMTKPGIATCCWYSIKTIANLCIESILPAAQATHCRRPKGSRTHRGREEDRQEVWGQRFDGSGNKPGDRRAFDRD